MSAQASAKAPEPKDDTQRSSKLDQTEAKIHLFARLRVWRQVLIAELLNLLEKRRYDAVSN